MINREDMLELTRRMTLKRHCFGRIAGAYFDADGVNTGTFNIHFGNLDAVETKKNLEIAKAIPFSDTNEQLKRYRFPDGEERKQSMWQMLSAFRKNGLKDDALLDVFYEIVASNYHTVQDYAVLMFYGCYDVPVKGTDKAWMEGSEEVYDFVVCAVSPLEGEYEPGKPEFGFLFPAFTDRSSDSRHIYIYHQDPGNLQKELLQKILGAGPQISVKQP